VKKTKRKKKKLKKPKTKRSRTKNAALNKHLNSKVRQEYLDYDYLDQLSPKELDWLNRFTEENLGANFNHAGPKFTKTKKKKREIYNENNARNRCLYGKLKSQGRIYSTEDSFSAIEAEVNKEHLSPDELENEIINYIDDKLEKSKV